MKTTAELFPHSPKFEAERVFVRVKIERSILVRAGTVFAGTVLDVPETLANDLVAGAKAAIVDPETPLHWVETDPNLATDTNVTEARA